MFVMVFIVAMPSNLDRHIFWTASLCASTMKRTFVLHRPELFFMVVTLSTPKNGKLAGLLKHSKLSKGGNV